MSKPVAVFHSHTPDRFPRSFAFSDFRYEIVALTPEEVVPALERAEEAVGHGLHAAGYLAYEAARGLHAGFTTFPDTPMPLVWFGIFGSREETAIEEEPAEETCTTTHWTSSMDAGAYGRKVERIRDYIAAGDTYQVNFTFRRRFHLDGSPRALYRQLCRAQRASFCAYLEVGRWWVVSASPELFFSLDGDRMTVRPMKGTAPRGRWLEEDLEKRQALRNTEKERAENLMIVDLLRNDLGIISEPGSIRVESLFDVETLETVHQMTSTISSTLRGDITIPDVFRALFPCGSVTGAPKKRTMELIAMLEDSARGIYTGCIGFISPGNNAVFSVAIRTAAIDATTGAGEMGIGSGITWDSDPAAEYRECLAKGRFALSPRPEFDIVETLRWEPGKGYFLLRRHLRRMGHTAEYFGFSWNRFSAVAALQAAGAALSGMAKVRLLLARDGRLTTEAAPLDVDPPDAIFPVAFAEKRINSQDAFLFHKTTHRPAYAEELGKRPDLLDVIFVNEREEVTEGANHNLVAHLDGDLVTPPREAGLLAGTFRDALVAAGVIKVRTLHLKDLQRAEALYLINSVRGWRKVRLVP